jgi:hypothetical protein
MAHEYYCTQTERQQLHLAFHQLSLGNVEAVLQRHITDFYDRAKELADQTWAANGDWESMYLTLDNNDVWVFHNACFAAERPLHSAAEWAREVYEPPELSANLPGKQRGEGHPYGAGWTQAREKALNQAGRKCGDCGMSQEEHRSQWSVGLHVHHIKPVRQFEQYQKAHTLDNLVPLCIDCHSDRHSK